MLNGISKNECTGCAACLNICPRKCITMKPDTSGFLFPEIDDENCSKCGACERVCPLNSSVENKGFFQQPKVFAAWSLDETVRLQSTSGGIFTELAKSVIEQGGYVVGARYNEAHLVEHYMIESIEDIAMLRQSKYLQSEIGFIYRTIKEKLDKGQIVAFCGSPCQVASLLNVLGKNYDNLITFDFICRGTNSPKAYSSYLAMLEKEYKSKIKRVWFKNKTYGWHRFSTRIEFENGEIYIKDRYSDLFILGYVRYNLYMRSCCFNCKYKTIPRIADLTLGDFWGIENNIPMEETEKGTSVIMVNSEKGNLILESIKEKLFIEENKFENIIPANKCILHSAEKNPESEAFLKMLDHAPFDKCYYQYTKISPVKKIKVKVKKYIKRIFKLLNINGGL